MAWGATILDGLPRHPRAGCQVLDSWRIPGIEKLHSRVQTQGMASLLGQVESPATGEHLWCYRVVYHKSLCHRIYSTQENTLFTLNDQYHYHIPQCTHGYQVYTQQGLNCSITRKYAVKYVIIHCYSNLT